MEEMKWVDQINEEIKRNGPDENEQWKRHSIYKVPPRVTDLNKKAYKPQAVSFGPYHYGEEQLKGMEEHKHRALLHFLKRTQKPIELLFQHMDQVVQEVRDSYKPLDQIWMVDNTPRFLQLMILDGCFLLEILRVANEYDCVPDDYADNDPVFGEHGKLYVMPYIKRDMLMLENQLPMTVLHTLIEVETGMPQEEEVLNKRILRFLNPSNTPLIGTMGKCTHVLDVYRKSLIQQQGPTHPTKTIKWPRLSTLESGNSDNDDIIRSAIELLEAGVTFKKSRTQSLIDVSFNDGVLRLPTIVVDDATGSMLLNLIAYERLHVGAGNEVTSYVFFMDTIIDNGMDVALLNRCGILVNALGSDKDVAKLFNSLSRDVTVDPQGVLDVVRMNISHYCKKPWNRWRANLIHTYFRNPWAIVSLVAGVLLFVLTIVQTVFTVRQGFPGGDDQSSTPITPRPPRFP